MVALRNLGPPPSPSARSQSSAIQKVEARWLLAGRSDSSRGNLIRYANVWARHRDSHVSASIRGKKSVSRILGIHLLFENRVFVEIGHLPFGR